VKVTSTKGIETTEWYNYSFFQLTGEEEWKLGKEVGDSGYGTPIYELVDLE
jgi:hypothetical protein